LARRADPTERLRQVQSLPEDERAPRLLLEAATDESLQVARAALARLSRVGGAEEAAALRERLLSADPALVPAVAFTLRKLDPGRTAAESAIAGIGSDSPSVRMNAALALAELDHPGRNAALRAALEDEMAGVRRAAAQGLGRGELTPPDVSALEGRLGDREGPVRTAAVRTLARSRRRLDRLRRVLRDPEPAVRLELARHARLLSDDFVRGLARDAHPDVRAQALWSLAESPREGLGRRASDALSDQDWRVRHAACRAVSATGMRSAATSLIACLLDPHETVRAAALRTLNELFGPRVIDVLTNGLARDDTRLRRALIYAAAEADAAGALAEVARYAEDDDADVRTAVVHLAARASTDEAAALLGVLRNDVNPGVAHAALTALDAGAR
jgi:HEAT repeat protein